MPCSNLTKKTPTTTDTRHTRPDTTTPPLRWRRNLQLLTLLFPPVIRLRLTSAGFQPRRLSVLSRRLSEELLGQLSHNSSDNCSNDCLRKSRHHPCQALLFTA